jgi:hypothetical protein
MAELEKKGVTFVTWPDSEISKFNYMKNGTPLLRSMPYNDSILVLHSF